MGLIARISVSALLFVACLAPSGARAGDENLRAPFGGATVSERTPQADGGANIQISFIESPSVLCSQPNPAANVCMITFPRLAVNAAPNYLIYLTVELNDRLVGRFSGFFQTSLDVANPFGQGIKVACGKPGSGGDPLFGRSYRYTIRAMDSADLKSANYGTIYCPAFRGPIPLIP